MVRDYDGLEPIGPADALRLIEPDDALGLYLDHEQTGYSKNTVQAYRYRLQYFVEWCVEAGSRIQTN